VYLVVLPIFRHGARGAVVAHQVTIDGGGNGGGLGGMAYIPGNYMIFPATDATPTTPIAYVGVVPDGVRRVRWQFACLSNGRMVASGCQLPSPRIADVAVHHNLAVLQTDESYIADAGAYAGVTKVTWYGADGLTKVFTNQNAAVPFPGAPARHV
jgi:hypothetical protein